MLHDLQEEEAPGEQRKKHQYRRAGDADAQLELLQLALAIPELRHG